MPHPGPNVPGISRFLFSHFGRFSADFRGRTRQNVVAVTWVRLWKKLLRRDKKCIFHDFSKFRAPKIAYLDPEPRAEPQDLSQRAAAATARAKPIY